MNTIPGHLLGSRGGGKTVVSLAGHVFNCHSASKCYIVFMFRGKVLLRF